MPRHILVLGGTSPAGIAFCHAALRDDHTLTLYIRNASKLPSEISNSDKVTVIIGELKDSNAVEKAVSCGAKTCVSFAGPVIGQKGQPITEGYRVIIPLLQKYTYTRVLFTSTASYRAPEDSFSLLFSLLVWSVYLFYSSAYKDINSMTPLVTALPTTEMNWTVFRVPMLKDGKAVPVKATFVGQGAGLVLERKALAVWVLEEMERGNWIGKCPALSNA